MFSKHLTERMRAESLDEVSDERVASRSCPVLWLWVETERETASFHVIESSMNSDFNSLLVPTYYEYNDNVRVINTAAIY